MRPDELYSEDMEIRSTSDSFGSCASPRSPKSYKHHLPSKPQIHTYTTQNTQPHTQWLAKEDPAPAPAHPAQPSLHAPPQHHSASRLAHPPLQLLQPTLSTPLLHQLLPHHQLAPLLHPRAQVFSLTWLLPPRTFPTSALVAMRLKSINFSRDTY